MVNVLIVEDEPKMRRLLELNLGEEGWTILSAGDAETGLKILDREGIDLVLCDIKLPGMGGMEFLQAVRRANAEIPVVLMTAYGSVEMAVEAMKSGASDYVLKPFSLDEIKLIVRKELDVRRLRAENVLLREELRHRYEYPNIVACSAKMQEVLATVERAAPTNSTILIGGESGVGKELIARAIHQRSRRASGPFVKINCTAIPENLLESELFGYEKGRSQVPLPASPENSSWQTRARCFWTRSATFRKPCRPSSSEYCRNVNLNGWAEHERSKSTCGSSLPPTAISVRPWKKGHFERIFITGSTSCRLTSRRSASTKRTFPIWSSTSFQNVERKAERRSAASRRRHCSS